jgi:hypothetical protein
MLSKNSTYLCLSLILSFYLNILYFNVFTVNLTAGVQYNIFTTVYIYDFIDVYYPNILRLQSGESLPLNNSTGISYIFYYLTLLVPNNYIIFYATIINYLTFCGCAYYIYRINKLLGISNSLLFILFLNPVFIYYSQGINKEPFSLLYCFLLIYYSMRRKYILLLIITLVFSIIRLQHLLIFIFFFIFNYKGIINFKWKFMLIYLVSVIASVKIAIDSSIPDQFKLRPGISSIIFELDQNYYIGTLFYGLLRIIQTFYDQLFTMYRLYNNGYINLYSAKEIFPNIILLLSSVFIWKKMKHFRYNKYYYYFICIFSYLIMIITSHIIHSRYIFPVITMLLIVVLDRKIKLGNKLLP